MNASEQNSENIERSSLHSLKCMSLHFHIQRQINNQRFLSSSRRRGVKFHRVYFISYLETQIFIRFGREL